MAQEKCRTFARFVATMIPSRARYTVKMPRKGQIFKINMLENLLATENSCVTLVPCKKLLAVPPFFLNDMKSGIIFLLNSFLKKYDRALNGIPIGYQKVKVLMDENTGIIQMGNAETEVNVSVEFYIFQPKVGSSLQGVINKKSRTHIGCLVHKYFNATILKPETIEYEDWLCKDLNVNDTIVFKVKDLDFTGLLPHIEGIIDDENFVSKKSSEVHRQTPTEESSLSLSKQKEKCDDAIQCKVLSKSVNNVSSFDETDSSDKRLKKKKKKNGIEEHMLQEGENKKSSEDDIENKSKNKKKKGKSREEEKFTDVVPPTNTMENVTHEIEQSDELHSTSKIKKKKKKKDKKDDSDLQDKSSKNECEGSSLLEDNIFYSTQLEPSKPLGKPIAPFCSPIPQKKQENGSSSLCGEDSEARSKKKRKKDKIDDSKSKERVVEAKVVDDNQPSVQELVDKIFKEQLSKINQESASEKDVEVSSLKTKKGKSKSLSSDKKKKESSKSHTSVKEKEKVKSSVESSRKTVETKKERDKSQLTIPELLSRRANRQISVSDVETSATPKTQDVLYEKLLSEARESISVGLPDTPPQIDPKKSNQKKLKRKKDTLDESDGPSSPKKLKNGNMYDYSCPQTPKKIDPDKSLFSDSDSNTKRSPVKKEVKVNGVVKDKKEEAFSLEKVMKNLIENERKRLESETETETGGRESEGSGNKSAKEKKKKKKKEKEKENAEESLYEKLLKHARNLVNL